MDLAVGQKRTFSFSEFPFEIKEIIEQPQGITLQWTWTSSICPHCRKKIERTTNHSFFKIEILIECDKEGKSKENITKQDLVLLGHSIDGKLMNFPIDKFDDVLRLSKNFKSLTGGE